MSNPEMSEVENRNAVLGTPIRPPFPEGIEVAYFALGCFWPGEQLFWGLDGVYTTAVGYMNGTTPNPTGEEVESGETGHAEAVLVAFDPAKVSYADLLKVFFEEHDPTQGMRQGYEVGTHVRSGIYFVDDAQRATAETVLKAYDQALREAGHDPVTTEIEPAGPLLLRRGRRSAVPPQEPQSHSLRSGRHRRLLPDPDRRRLSAGTPVALWEKGVEVRPARHRPPAADRTAAALRL